MLEIMAFLLLGILAVIGISSIVDLVSSGVLRDSERMITVVLAARECGEQGKKKRSFLRSLEIERQNCKAGRIIIVDYGVSSAFLEELRQWAGPKNDVVLCKPWELEFTVEAIKQGNGRETPL